MKAILVGGDNDNQCIASISFGSGECILVGQRRREVADLAVRVGVLARRVNARCNLQRESARRILACHGNQLLSLRSRKPYTSVPAGAQKKRSRC